MDLIERLRPMFDGLKKISPNGGEYWMARDLQLPLGYSHWRNFEGVIEKARMSCEGTGNDPDNHIYQTIKKVDIGSGAEREICDYFVSRFGAYLIAMNGDPQLPEIAAAQTYFAVQTRRQEVADQFRGNLEKRIELRERVKDANIHLNRAAQAAGVENWGLFHNAGYLGLYGLGLKEIKGQKGIGKDDLLDRAGRAELAMNEFRITQAEQAITRDGIQGDVRARDTHKKVGKAVRKAIADLGGTMPEDLPPEPSVKKLATDQAKKQLPKPDEKAESE